jgi:hypothetical protein
MNSPVACKAQRRRRRRRRRRGFNDLHQLGCQFICCKNMCYIAQMYRIWHSLSLECAYLLTSSNIL